MKNKKIILIFILALFMLFLFTIKSNANYLNSLNYDVQINEDGTMDVTETWNIDISSTNTLYKTFELDSSKYSGIKNVTVTEVGKKMFTETNRWAYHLTKDYYFGGINSDGDFEIAWGVGLDNSSDTRTYKISYTVTDAIAKYNDCAELYWKFIGDKFEINANKVTGTITLPNHAPSKEDIKVWGHIETLNGEIYATNTNTVSFKVDNYSGGRFLEVRVAMPENMIVSTGRTYNTNKLQNIIAEETKWANDANERREAQAQAQAKTEKIISIGFIIVTVIIMLLLIKQTIKYIKILKNIKKLKPTIEYDYFRELPNKNSTPADALFLYNKGVKLNYTMFGNIFSATLLNLSLKKFFQIKVEKDEKEKEEVIISRNNHYIQELKYEEKTIARFVNSAINEESQCTIKNLQKYIKNHGESVSSLIENTVRAVENKNIKEENYGEETAKQKNHYTTITVIYFAFVLFTIWVIPIVSILLILNIILLILNSILAICINSKLSNLTQKGIDEREKWKGLKKYMEDFSLLNEKEIPAIEIWEEYLVYATVFGIADKVIKQLKLVYPQIEQMDNFSTTPYVYLMSHTNFNSSFSSAINSSISSTMSSGSGRRRRILWRRRRRPVAGGRRRRKIKRCCILNVFVIIYLKLNITVCKKQSKLNKKYLKREIGHRLETYLNIV